MSYFTTINQPTGQSDRTGQPIFMAVDAIWLPGIPCPIVLTQLDQFELNAEDIEDATELWVSFEGEEYALSLPERDSLQWNWLIDLIDPA
ncbi:hypothetical protein F7734_48940 [Scytonema sp. UIC 10036]|uniref:hypothetical protein n=1 Tax=Scytonema sp. UIC 10036 TaxID=2304196 RepID=UPI0012DA6B03|nr:hypothetical protein [Scytonema sp. UIC 10036]MUG99785.1 hypothetical protein [Scytonema sp. UIC 10036]